MASRTIRALLSTVSLSGVLLGLGGIAAGQTVIESSAETRFQLDLHVPDAPLAAMLPAGWSLNVAAQGNAKDANLRVVFVDRLTVNGPDGKPIGSGSNRLVYLAAPVKDPSGGTSQLIIGGITADPSEAPGPFAVYLPAATHSMERTTTDSAGGMIETQKWALSASSGEQVEMQIQFESGAANKSNPSDVKFYSAKDTNVYQISRQEQVLDILRNTNTNPRDRVKEFSFKVSGGSFSKLFDGTEKVLSWDHIVWINRSVLRPESSAEQAVH